MIFSKTKRPKVNGVRVGESGAGFYSGYRLDYGDDFKTLPTMWNNRNLNGQYSSSSGNALNRRIDGSSNYMLYVDQHWCGGDSQAGIGQKYSQSTIEGEYLVLTAAPIPSEAYSILPTDYTQGGGDANSKPQLFSACLKTWPSYMYSGEGNYIIEAVVKVPSGNAAAWWGAFWTAGIDWPYHGEIDIFEGQKNGTYGLYCMKGIHSSSTQGGPDDPRVTTLTYSTDVDVHVIAKKVGNTLEFWDDFGSAGTPSLKYTITDTVANLKGAHDVILNLAVSGNWQTGFNVSQWPFTILFKWFRVWMPTNSPTSRPLKILGQINQMAGGSWSYSIPDDATLFGADYTVNYRFANHMSDNQDTPGYLTRANKLPGGCSIDWNARTLSGTIPSTYGGRQGVMFTASSASGGAARRAAIFFNVAPVNKSLFSNQTVAQGGAVNLSIAYAAFHSGNLGAHTYTVNKTGGSWLTITGNDTGAISITGTAPNSAEVVTLAVICTNGIGQATTVTRTITVS